MILCSVKSLIYFSTIIQIVKTNSKQIKHNYQCYKSNSCSSVQRDFIIKMHELAIETGNHTGKINVVDAESNLNGDDIIDLDQVIQEKIAQKKRFYAIEVSPVPSAEDLNYRQFNVQPVFTSITWLLDHNIRIEPIGDAPALKLAQVIRKSNPVLSHLTCFKMTANKLEEILNHNVKNVLALRGDLQTDEQPWKYAIELVRAIRQLNAKATIAVAGYPEVHHAALNRDSDLQFLKQKVDAGANFIVTNVCFSFEALSEFIRSCRAIGITVPIIPGIFIPSSYTSLVQMCRICKITVPEKQMEKYRAVKSNSEQFKAFAMANAQVLLDQLFNFEFENIYGIHFFTLNKYENIYEILQRYEFKN